MKFIAGITICKTLKR